MVVVCGEVPGELNVALGLVVAALLEQRLGEHGCVQRTDPRLAHALVLVVAETKLPLRGHVVRCQELDVAADLRLAGYPGLEADLGQDCTAPSERLARPVE